MPFIHHEDDAQMPSAECAMLAYLRMPQRPAMSTDHGADSLADNFQPAPAECATEIGAEQVKRSAQAKPNRSVQPKSEIRAGQLVALVIVGAIGCAVLLVGLVLPRMHAEPIDRPGAASAPAASQPAAPAV